MADLDTLLIKIEADLKDYDKGLKASAGKTATLESKVKKSAKGMQKAFTDAAAKVAKFGAVAAGVAAATGAAMLKMGLESGDALAKTADSLGVTTKELAGLQLAGEYAGLGIAETNTSLKFMQKNMSDAAAGTGEAKVAFEAFGLSALELKKKSPAEAFAILTDKINQVPNAIDRTNFAMKVFGRSGAKIINLTGETIRQAAGDVDDLGAALNRVDAAKIEMANDAMTRVKTAFKGASQTIATTFAPMLKVAADRFTEMIKNNDAFKIEIVAGIKTGIVMVAKFADAWVGLEMIWEALKLAWKGTELVLASGLANIDQAITDMANNAIAALNTVIEAANELPGVEIDLVADIEPNETLQEMATDAQEAFNNAEASFLKFTTQPLPSENVAAWLEEIETAANEAAEKIAATKPGGVDAGGGVEVGEDPETIARKAALQTQLDDLANKLMSEEDMLLDANERRLEMVMQAQMDDLLSAQAAADLRYAIDADYQDKLTKLVKKGAEEQNKFKKMSGNDQVKSTAKSATGMLQVAGKYNKTAEKAARVAGIADATISMWQGVAAGVKLGYPAAIPAVAAALATGGMAIANLGGSASASAPTVAADAAGASTAGTGTQPSDDDELGLRPTGGTIVNVYPQGNILTEQELNRQIADGLQLANDDGIGATA